MKRSQGFARVVVILGLLAIPPCIDDSAAQTASTSTPEKPVATSADDPPAAAPSVTAPRPAPPHPMPGAGDPHGLSPHGMPQGMPKSALTGSPFGSQMHRMQAARARRGQMLAPESAAENNAEIPAGTIAILVRDGDKQPLADVEVKLDGIRRSIAEGDRFFSAETKTDAEGRASFRDQNTDTVYVYEVSVEQDGAKYTSGQFSFQHEQGVIVSLHVFPVTTKMDDAFIFARSLYAVEPRTDVFQIQTLYRIHNASGRSWRAVDFPVVLPPGAKAFQPGNVKHVSLREEDGRVLVSGTFTPGQQEFSFAFQLPNERTETASLEFPMFPHTVDAKIVLESSPRMGLVVPGFDAPIRTQSPNGHAALLVQRDFLDTETTAPTEVRAQITGLPPKGKGPLYATAIAAAIAALGIAFALSRENRGKGAIAATDRGQARSLILDELVALERAHKLERVGVKTYEATKRSLLDALARLDLALHADENGAEEPTVSGQDTKRTANS